MKICFGSILIVLKAREEWRAKLTLLYLNGDSLLVIGGSGENLRFFGWDNWVTGDEFSHNTTDSLDTESQGTDIEKDDIYVVFSGKNTSLNKWRFEQIILRKWNDKNREFLFH